MVASKVKKWGNSLGIIIPAETAKIMSLSEGDVVDVGIIKKERTSALGIFKGARSFKKEEGLLDREEFW